MSFGFLSKSKKSLMSGFGSKTYFHIRIQNIVTTPPTNVMDEMEYNVSLDNILTNEETRCQLVQRGDSRLRWQSLFRTDRGEVDN